MTFYRYVYCGLCYITDVNFGLIKKLGKPLHYCLHYHNNNNNLQFCNIQLPTHWVFKMPCISIHFVLKIYVFSGKIIIDCSHPYTFINISWHKVELVFSPCGYKPAKLNNPFDLYCFTNSAKKYQFIVNGFSLYEHLCKFSNFAKKWDQ